MTKREFAQLSTQAQRAYVAGQKEGLAQSQQVFEQVLAQVTTLEQWQREALTKTSTPTATSARSCEEAL